MQEEIKLSIACNTYNHEAYIADAIESFLMQKTTHKFEILIYDDASTDKTAEIIKKYEGMYPDIIKPIYQTENQYSKGAKVGKFNWDRAVGKYIAICEGDDYWTDPYKIEKQVDYLEKNPECSLCVHAAKVVNAKTNKVLSHIRPSKENKIFSTEEIIYGGGGLFATNSMVYRRIECKVIPKFYDNAPVGDYPLTIFLSLLGKVYYMDEFMSNYRTNVEGSWTNRNSSSQKLIFLFNNLNKMLDEVDEYTMGRYKGSIQKTKLCNQYNILMLQENYKEIKAGECKNIYDGLIIKEKIKILIKQYCPVGSRFIKIIKRKFK